MYWWQFIFVEVSLVFALSGCRRWDSQLWVSAKCLLSALSLFFFFVQCSVSRVFPYCLFVSLTPILISQITKRSLKVTYNLTIMTTTAIFFYCPPSSSKWPFQHTEKCLWDIGIKSHGRQERSDCVKGKMECAFVRRQSGYDADPSIRCLKHWQVC